MDLGMMLYVVAFSAFLLVVFYFAVCLVLWGIDKCLNYSTTKSDTPGKECPADPAPTVEGTIVPTGVICSPEGSFFPPTASPLSIQIIIGPSISLPSCFESLGMTISSPQKSSWEEKPNGWPGSL